jgi:pilus assembly protein CpaB
VDPDALAAPSLAVGSIARVSIPTGSIVSSSKIAKLLDVGLTLRIHSGMRAISIPIDRVKGVANLIQPGDHIDVIALTRAEPGRAPRALTILRNKVVLAMGSMYETTAATPAPDAQMATATLEVSPSEAALLALADVNTTLRLALRTPKELGRPQPIDRLVLSAPPISAGARPAGPDQKKSVAPAAPRPRSNAVTVIDGDRIVGLQ